jgi:hypothetical protein
LLILSANSPRGSFDRNLGELEHAGRANPGRLAPRAEFPDSIRCCSRPKLPDGMAIRTARIAASVGRAIVMSRIMIMPRSAHE